MQYGISSTKFFTFGISRDRILLDLFFWAEITRWNYKSWISNFQTVFFLFWQQNLPWIHRLYIYRTSSQIRQNKFFNSTRTPEEKRERKEDWQSVKTGNQEHVSLNILLSVKAKYDQKKMLQYWYQSSQLHIAVLWSRSRNIEVSAPAPGQLK